MYTFSVKEMLSLINDITRSQMFLTLSFLFTIVCCTEFPAGVGNLKHSPGNVTTPFKEDSRNDRFQSNEPIEMKFFIKQNTIIRTGESRDLGAKYLNETRLSSNHECLTWCLETPTCNTAVYEEKNMQSCYMFDCGSPAKPLCKFTDHNFFTSSVLKMTQHSYELSQWGRQVQKERNGSSKEESEVKSATPVVSVASIVTTSPVSTINKEKPGKKESICHHYQFQCFNSSECIAIYNVCDGIPQCPDASDESPDLKCPTKDVPKKAPAVKDTVLSIQPTLVNKTPVLKQEQLPVRPSVPYKAVQNADAYKKPPEHKEMVYKNHKWPNSYPGSPMTKTASQYRHRGEDSDGLGSPFIHKHSQFISANDPHVEKLNRWASDYDQYSPHSTSLEQQYNNPYERIDEQYVPNQMSPDYDGGKSFSGYRQDDIPYWPSQDILQDNSYTVDEFPQTGAQNLNKVMGYPDKESAYSQQITRTAEQYPEAKLSMHNKPLLNPGQPSDADDYKLQRYPHLRQQQPYMTLEDSVPQHYSNYPEMKTKGFNSMQNVDDTMYSNDDLIRASIVNQLPKKLEQIHHQREYDLKHLKNAIHPVSQEKRVEESTEAPKDNSLIIVKPTSHSKSIQKTVLDFKMSVAELYQSSSTHTHEANSAILALVLGITVSFFLIILLACRMKTLRRRMSRKGRGLAHDADYLVNGMYL